MIGGPAVGSPAESGLPLRLTESLYGGWAIRPGDACSADGFTGALDLSFGTGGTVLLRTDEALTRVGSFTDPGLSLDLFC